MRSSTAYAELRRLGKPVVTTEEAALRLRATRSAACRILGRLAAAGLVRPLRRGLWSPLESLDPLVLTDYLTAPYPAYVSFQSALYQHGLISQVPHVIYLASLAPTRRVATTLGTFSIHQLAPEFFGGYVIAPGSGVRLATPEKALCDTLYLANTRSRLFARLPELELPPRFSERAARRWIARCPAAYRRTMMSRRLDAILAARDRGSGG